MHLPAVGRLPPQGALNLRSRSSADASSSMLSCPACRAPGRAASSCTAMAAEEEEEEEEEADSRENLLRLASRRCSGAHCLPPPSPPPPVLEAEHASSWDCRDRTSRVVAAEVLAGPPAAAAAAWPADQASVCSPWAVAPLMREPVPVEPLLVLMRGPVPVEPLLVLMLKGLPVVIVRVLLRVLFLLLRELLLLLLLQYPQRLKVERERGGHSHLDSSRLPQSGRV